MRGTLAGATYEGLDNARQTHALRLELLDGGVHRLLLIHVKLVHVLPHRLIERLLRYLHLLRGHRPRRLCAHRRRRAARPRPPTIARLRAAAAGTCTALAGSTAPLDPRDAGPAEDDAGGGQRAGARAAAASRHAARASFRRGLRGTDFHESRWSNAHAAPTRARTWTAGASALSALHRAAGLAAVMLPPRAGCCRCESPLAAAAACANWRSPTRTWPPPASGRRGTAHGAERGWAREVSRSAARWRCSKWARPTSWSRTGRRASRRRRSFSPWTSTEIATCWWWSMRQLGGQGRGASDTLRQLLGAQVRARRLLARLAPPAPLQLRQRTRGQESLRDHHDAVRGADTVARPLRAEHAGGPAADRGSTLAQTLTLAVAWPCRAPSFAPTCTCQALRWLSARDATRRSTPTPPSSRTTGGPRRVVMASSTTGASSECSWSGAWPQRGGANAERALPSRVHGGGRAEARLGGVHRQGNGPHDLPHATEACLSSARSCLRTAAGCLPPRGAAGEHRGCREGFCGLRNNGLLG
eukprot:scaffold2270_cov362-Prasinococcus_capsulatus_cf.AAC.3